MGREIHSCVRRSRLTFLPFSTNPPPPITTRHKRDGSGRCHGRRRRVAAVAVRRDSAAPNFRRGRDQVPPGGIQRAPPCCQVIYRRVVAETVFV